MIAKSAVYIEVSWVVGAAEHDCSDLAVTLGIGTRGLCDGRHQNGEKKLSQRETLGVISEASSRRPAPERGDSECRPKPGHAIARQSLVDRIWPVVKRYPHTGRCLERMMSTPAPTAIAATKKPPAMAAEVSKVSKPAQAMSAAPSEKIAVYMLSSPEWLWSGLLVTA
jgi:hypothetical protein